MAPNDEHHYNSQTYAGDRATEVHRTMQRMPDEDRSSRTELQASIAGSQSQQLASQVRMGDDRAIGSAPNWAAMTSTQLHAAATQRNSPDTADSLGRAFNEGGNRLADAANRLLTAVGKLDAAWTGVASSSARGALTPLAESAGAAGVAGQLMGAQMARQTAAASEVRKLPPPKEFDYKGELVTALANPNPIAGLADMAAKKAEADAVKREQVTYLNTYTQTMTAVDGQMPTFIEPTESISGRDSGRSHLTSGSVNYQAPVGAVPGQHISPGGPTPPRGGAPLPGTGSGPQLPGHGTGDQDFGPRPGDIGTDTSGYAPPSPPTTTNLPGGPQPPTAGGYTTGTPGAGPGGFGGFGSPGAAGGPGASSGSPARGLGVGGGQGVAPETAGARGGAGGAGRGAVGQGMGAGGGGRGRDEEDQEHERASYLVEPDPDSTFGTDEVTAPPVIGQD